MKVGAWNSELSLELRLRVMAFRRMLVGTLEKCKESNGPMGFTVQSYGRARLLSEVPTYNFGPASPHVKPLYTRSHCKLKHLGILKPKIAEASSNRRGTCLAAAVTSVGSGVQGLYFLTLRYLKQGYTSQDIWHKKKVLRFRIQST